MPATGALQRHAGVHHRQRAAADRRHRRRAVRFENVRDDADGVGELLLGRHHRRQRSLRQRAVADFAAAGAAHERPFADREGREVVVEHEALPRLALEALDLLRIVGGAERAGDERLRLAAGEHRRAVGAREHAGLDPDRPDLVELAAVEPDAVRQHLVAQDLLLQLLEDVPWRRPSARLRPPAATRPDRRAPGRRSRSFRACRGSASPRSAGTKHLLFDLAVEVVADFLLRDRQLLLAGLFGEIVDRRRRSA